MSNVSVANQPSELLPNQIEFQGKPFNCFQCDTTSCCQIKNYSYQNQAACKKCRCQALYGADPGNSQKTGFVEDGNKNKFKCKCRDDQAITKSQCDATFLRRNKLITPRTYIDCSQNTLVSGDGNVLENVKMESTCNAANNAGGGGGSKNTSTNTQTNKNSKYPMGLSQKQFKIVVIVIIVLLFFLLIF